MIKKNLIVFPMIQQQLIILNGLKIKNINTDKQIISGSSIFHHIGIGSLNSVINLHQLITKYKPTNVILVGCAGAITQNLKVGQVVQSFYFFNRDNINQGFEYNGNSILPIKNVYSLVNNKVHGIILGVGISTDVFVDSSKRRLKIKKDILKNLCVNKDSKMFVDMQSFGCAHLCNRLKTNFTVLRQISDIAGRDSSWSVNNWFSRQHDELINAVKYII